MTKLSGKVAIVDGGAVVGIRNLGNDPVEVKYGVLPLVEVWPDLADGETYGAPTFDIGADKVTATYAVEAAPRRLVLKSIIVTRLYEAGKLDAAQSALAANTYARERWYAPDKPGVYADDAEALALLVAIGADPDVILAP